MSRRSLALAALLLAPLALLACDSEEARPPGPGLRIVLVTLDTLRLDSFAGRPGADGDMPHTRRFADEALVFRRHYAATSSTQPTHASLFTGLHPWQHGVSRNGMVLAPGIETVAERLRARGFETAAVVASFAVHGRFGFGRGFEHFDDDFSRGRRERWSEVEVPGEHFYSPAEEVTARALARLDAASAPKQFFWFHYFDPHSPYGDAPGGEPLELKAIQHALERDPASADERLAAARAGYDRDVRHMDEALGRLWERLRRDAARFETHVVVVSDHGESFGERGALGHGESLTPEQVHVPLVVHSPRVAPGVSDRPTGSVDVAATLDALGGGSGLGVGRDLLAQASGDTETVFGMRRTFAAPRRDVRADGSVRFVQGRRFYAVSGGRLYVGDAAAVEDADGGAVDAAQARRLALLFGRFESELDGRAATELVDDETQAALEALGYTR